VLGYRWRRYTFGGRAHDNTACFVLVSDAAGETLVRLPAFYQIDLRCDLRVLLDKFLLDAYGELVNVTLSRQVVGPGQQPSDRPLTEEAFRIVPLSSDVHGEF
jgi:hypothetical protein